MDISLSQIQLYTNRFLVYQPNQILQNSAGSTLLTSLCVNQNVIKRYNHYFSNEIDPEMKVTNQNKSGRCWIFAALNMMRVPTIKEHKLDTGFEFSQSHLFFWDKFERCNYFFNNYLFFLALLSK